MENEDQPLVLQLAPLPRQQIGPFFLLGVEKDAPKDVVEAAWAQRLILVRKSQIRVALEDINWAREIINDTERRIRADAYSLNLDTTDGFLRKLRERYEGKGRGAGGCKPLDVEKNLSEYTPPTPLPDRLEVRSQIPLPEVPREVPAVKLILDEAVKAPIDPWDMEV